MTITAISTPHGVGGIAVIRLSGGDALSIARRHCAIKAEPRRAQFLPFRTGDTIVDEIVATYFQAPHSYTGLDTVELSCHGSTYVQQAILQALIASGARLAEPGEFTQQALLNGRLDLSQAEAVADLIDSTNSAQHSLAINQLRGGYAQRLATLHHDLLRLTSLLELELDFSEEDVEFANRDELSSLTANIIASCRSLADSYRQGKVLKDGITVAIVGEPNVGKSTLLNAMLGEERAIVSSQAGTTRDTIEECLTLGGIRYRFIDTAGLRPTADSIEQAGIDRSYASAQKAQIVIAMFDAALPAAQKTNQLRSLSDKASLVGKHLIIVNNKSDLANAKPQPIAQQAQNLGCLTIAELNTTLKAGKNGAPGIPDEAGNEATAEITQALEAITQQSRDMLASQVPIVSNLRHQQALTATAAALTAALHGLHDGTATDLIAIDLRDALYHLGTITGQATPDDILHTIFSRFCIGK